MTYLLVLVYVGGLMALREPTEGACELALAKTVIADPAVPTATRVPTAAFCVQGRLFRAGESR